jgi:nitrite reductase/ring-hydroxylating ferredoxin subunit
MPPNADPTGRAQPRNKLSRRDFLTLTGKTLLALSGVIGIGELAMYLSYQPDPAPPERFNLGPADQYAIGSRTLIPEAHAVLIHTQAGFTALSLFCPHLGCTLKMNPETFDCPCHGSKFNASGSLINGPANKPLQILRVEETPEGIVILYTK